ncbi:MAG: 5-formyltetrahydrofolate cyclo-ligase [Pseudonocardiales bacterium]
MHSAAKASRRRELTAARLARPVEALESARRAVCAAVLTHSAAAGWGCVACYVPLRSEPGSLTLLGGLTQAGVRVLVPVLLADRDLDWAQWDPATAQAGIALGVTAAAEADALLVPALAVARDGTRLGRGGGSYDRVLRRVRPGVPVAALLFDGELVEELPREDWDRPVTAVVTPAGWYDLPDR